MRRDEYISGEAHRAMTQQADGRGNRPGRYVKGIVSSLIGVLVLGAAVYGGVAYLRQQHIIQDSNDAGSQADRSSNGSSNDSSGSSGGGAHGGLQSTGHGSVTGKVAAISSASITVEPTSGGSAQTYAITGNTSISDAKSQQFGSSDSGQSDSSDIHVGDTVLVTADSAHADQAMGILINPQ